jgi:ribose 5-phosphate isomerase B
MSNPAIIIGSDHAGFALKQILIKVLKSRGYTIHDVGVFSEEASDYPKTACEVARKVSGEEYPRGILICGTGIGMSIVANRFLGIRATLCHTVQDAELARKHNDSNILTMGGRTTKIEIAKKILDTWLHTEFEGGRHQRRVEMTDDLN